MSGSGALCPGPGCLAVMVRESGQWLAGQHGERGAPGLASRAFIGQFPGPKPPLNPRIGTPRVTGSNVVIGSNVVMGSNGVFSTPRRKNPFPELV